MQLNGKTFEVPVITSFKELTQYEMKGIKIMALANGEFYDPVNMATSLVRGISYFTGLDFDTSLDELDKFISDGGSMETLLDELTNDIEKMKEIGSLEGFSKGTKVPQDHKKKVTPMKQLI